MLLARLFMFISFSILGSSFAQDTEELVPADVVRQIKECEDTCQGYRSALYNFLMEMKPDTWGSAQLAFSNCQEKCPRCSLKKAVDAMKSIDLFSPTFPPESSRNIRYKQIDIIPAVTDCVSLWNDSAIFGCDKNPVENYTSDCILL